MIIQKIILHLHDNNSYLKQQILAKSKTDQGTKE